MSKIFNESLSLVYKRLFMVYKSVSFFVFFALLFSSCSRAVYLQVMKPAEITIPNHLKRLGVINRSVVNKNQETKDKVLNVLEGIVTGEEIGADRQASEECLTALMQTVQNQNRIEYYRIFPQVEGTGMTNGKGTLSWEEVDKICDKEKLDGLLILEGFDSDNSLGYSNGVDKVKNKDGTFTEVPFVNANANMHVTSQWRIYDRVNHRIFDQIMHTNDRGFTAKGSDQRSAANNLPNKRQMLLQTGFAAGQQFGARVSPVWVNVNRTIYKGKGDDMKFGYKLAKRNNYEKAAVVWNRNSNNPNPKIARKACFNMAVACELEGKLDLALEWSNKAYTTYGFRPAQHYSWVLQQRLQDEQKLKLQLGE